MEEIKEVPEGWEAGLISDLAEINPKKDTKKLSKDALVSFIRMEDTSEECKIMNMSDKVLSEVEKGYTNFHNKDILFAKITPCLENGKGGLATSLTNGVGFGSTEFHVLRPKKSCSIQILYHYSKYNKLRKKAASLMIGSAGQQRIQKDFFEAYTIGIPSDNEQIKIGKILDKIDQNIEKTEQTIDKYMNIKNGLMDDLLTGKRRIKDGKWVEETEFKEVDGVGRVPNDWEVGSLNKLAKLVGGYAFSSEDSTENGVRWLKIANVGFNKIKWDIISYLPIKFKDAFSDYILSENDIVMAMTRPLLDRNLKISFISSSDTSTMLNQRVGKFKLNKENDRYFLYYSIQYENSIRQIDLNMLGTDPPNISGGQIENIIITLPIENERKEIGKVIMKQDQLIEKEQQYLQKLKNLKSGIMEDLLTGKVRVKI